MTTEDAARRIGGPEGLAQLPILSLQDTKVTNAGVEEITKPLPQLTVIEPGW